MMGSRVASLAGSAAIHLLMLAFVLWMFRASPSDSVLFIDLTEPVVAEATSEATESGSRTPVRAESGAARGSAASRALGPDAPSASRGDATPPAAPPRAATEARPDPLSDRPPGADPPPIDIPVARTPAPIETPLDRDAPSAAPSASAESTQSITTTPHDGGRRDSVDDGRSAGGGANVTSANAGAGDDALGPSPAGPARGGGSGVRGGGTQTARATPGRDDGGPYHKALRQHVDAMIEYPPIVRRRGDAGTVEVDIFIGADGSIRDVMLAQSSGSPTVDRAAIDAVKQLPPMSFPRGLPPREVVVRLPLVFKLR
jgi:protein TonB